MCLVFVTLTTPPQKSRETPRRQVLPLPRFLAQRRALLEPILIADVSPVPGLRSCVAHKLGPPTCHCQVPSQVSRLSSIDCASCGCSFRREREGSDVNNDGGEIKVRGPKIAQQLQARRFLQRSRRPDPAQTAFNCPCRMHKRQITSSDA